MMSSGDNRGVRHIAAPVVALLVAAATVVLLAVTLVLPHPTVAGWLGIGLVAVCSIELVRVTWFGPFSPVAVMFWAFVAVWVGFPPLLQLRDRQLPWPDLPLDQHYVTAQVVVLVAAVGHLLGHLLARPGRPSDHPGPVGGTAAGAVAGAVAGTVAGTAAGAGSDRPGRISVEKSVVVTASATLLAAWCLPQTGGLLVRFTDREALQAAINAAGLRSGRDLALLGLLNTLPAAAALVALLLCLACWRNRSWAHLRARRVLAITTTVAVVLNLVYNNPLTANRFASFGVLLAAVLTVLRIRRQLWRTAFTLVIVLGLAVIYPLANSFRNERYRTEVRFGTQAYYTFDFDGFQQTVNTAFYVAVNGHTFGRHLVSALLFWVPRSLWEGKAIGAGNVVAAGRGYEFQNLAMPYWAEAYLEFGLAGVLIVFFLYGKLTRYLDPMLNRSAIGAGGLAAVLFAACQIGLLRGPLGAQIPFVGAAFVILVLAVGRWWGPVWGLTWPSHPPAAPGEAGEREAGEREAGERPRIAVVADWWWPDSIGGAEQSARAVSHRLAEFAEVTVFVPAPVERTYPDGPITVQAVHRPFARSIHASPLVRQGLEFLTSWTLPWVATRLAERLREFDPTVVVAHNVARTGPWLVRHLRTGRYRYVRVYHDLSDTCWRRSRLRQVGRGRPRSPTPCTTVCATCRVKASMMRRAGAPAEAVCVSEFVRDEVVKARLVTETNAVIGYPLSGTGAAAPAPPRPDSTDLVIGYLGRISPVKGIDAAIRTVAAFQRSHPDPPVALLVAGAGTAAYVAEMELLAETESVRAEFVGQLDVDEFCARVDVVLVPSRWLEAFGRVAVEVGGRGRPMLIAPMGGLPEAAAQSGGRYAFADFGDPASAAQALADLLAGPADGEGDGDGDGDGEGPTERPADDLPDVVVGVIRRLVTATVERAP